MALSFSQTSSNRNKGIFMQTCAIFPPKTTIKVNFGWMRIFCNLQFFSIDSRSKRLILTRNRLYFFCLYSRPLVATANLTARTLETTSSHCYHMCVWKEVVVILQRSGRGSNPGPRASEEDILSTPPSPHLAPQACLAADPVPEAHAI